eukprot:TRINITY_DN4973_c0_g1_i2.p1 TRINITY_DN4973_c0_g1~~TRINITY_DN4973_c0_g1_i2.p1  ORF type:complete len:322 (-),score=41.42 TRINITY_DN4973_c0_g1_i2:129-1094(-)
MARLHANVGNSQTSEDPETTKGSSTFSEFIPHGFVIRNTFLELVEKSSNVEAKVNGTARRRVRSLDEKRSSMTSCTSEGSGHETQVLSIPSCVEEKDIRGVESRAVSGCSSRARDAESTSSSEPSPPGAPQTSGAEQPKSSSSSSISAGKRRNRHRTRHQRYAYAYHEQHAPEARDAMSARLQSGTTVMVQNLPRDMSQAAFAWGVEALGFGDLYEFVYMPTCFKSGKSKSYAFVNLLDADTAISFALECEIRGFRVSRASVQGQKAIERYRHRLTRRVRNIRHRPIFADGMLDKRSGSDTQSSASGETRQHEEDMRTCSI